MTQPANDNNSGTVAIFLKAIIQGWSLESIANYQAPAVNIGSEDRLDTKPQGPDLPSPRREVRFQNPFPPLPRRDLASSHAGRR